MPLPVSIHQAWMLISRLKLKLGAATAAAACDDYVNVNEAEDSFYLKGCGLSELDFYPKLTTMMMIIINIDVIYPNSDDADVVAAVSDAVVRCQENLSFLALFTWLNFFYSWWRRRRHTMFTQLLISPDHVRPGTAT